MKAMIRSIGLSELAYKMPIPSSLEGLYLAGNTEAGRTINESSLDVNCQSDKHATHYRHIAVLWQKSGGRTSLLRF